MFQIAKAIFAVFRAGQSVSNSAAWKNAQLVGTLLTALVALASAFGFDLGLSDEEIVGGAVFIVAVVNGILVIVTSKKVGLPEKKPLPTIEERIQTDVDAALGLMNRRQPVTTKRKQKVSDNSNQFGFSTDRNG